MYCLKTTLKVFKMLNTCKDLNHHVVLRQVGYLVQLLLNCFLLIKMIPSKLSFLSFNDFLSHI